MGKSVSKLSKDDLQSLRQATYFDKRELQQWYKGFLRDCPLGQLSEEEFSKVFKQFFLLGIQVIIVIIYFGFLMLIIQSISTSRNLSLHCRLLVEAR